MTTATARVRTAAAAAGLVGALALTACSGGGSKNDTSSSATPTPTGSATGAVTDASGKLQGSWITTSKGTIVALVITGKKAGLFATGGSVCSGTAGAEAGMQMVHLTCTDGSKDRVTGMVDSVSKDGMKVTWSGKLGQETYTRAEGGKLPSGLPTAHTKQ
ncbi:hypothetical protein [Streptomyces cellostaticus]|uniref:hypothetical protein n=1 Tax=Streptomyces cellostaticus TaxID=67285 RepID=UPI000A54E1F5|nr:hypothetical protein [Streptomyces cellostaticus]